MCRAEPPVRHDCRVRFAAFTGPRVLSYDLAVLRPVVVAILTLALIAAGCSGDDEPDLSAVTSIPDEQPSSTTTTAPRAVAPDVIPDDQALITEEYVEGVLTALFQASGDAIRESIEAGMLTQQTIDTIDATHTVEASVGQVENLVDAELDGFARYRPDPGHVRAQVIDLFEVHTDCIVAEVSIDASELLVDPPLSSGLRTALRLVPAEQEQRATGLNPTAWVIADTLVTDDGGAPELPCEG